MSLGPTPDQKSNHRSPGWIAVFVGALGAVWLAVVFGTEIGAWWDELSSTLTTPEEFRVWVEGLGAWGPVAFFFAQTLQVIIAPVPGTLFPPVGALAFGAWPALGLSLAGMALGSAVVFLVARRWGRPLAVRLVGVDRIHRYEHLMTARGGLLIWLVFLVPLLPDDALCALAGLSGIAFRRFMIIATVGRIPAVAAGVFAMAGLQGAPAWVWVLATVLGVALLWFGLRYRDAVETRLLHMMGRHSGHQLPAEPIPSAGSGSGDRQQTEGDRSPGDILVLEETGRRDPLVSVLTVVVTTTAAAVLIGVATGVSGLASGITLVWGTALAVLVSSAREDD